MAHITRKDLEKYKTDEERLNIVAKLSNDLWDVVADWETEAKSEKAREVFHNYSRSMYHKEEFSCYGEL